MLANTGVPELWDFRISVTKQACGAPSVPYWQAESLAYSRGILLFFKEAFRNSALTKTSCKMTSLIAWWCKVMCLQLFPGSQMSKLTLNIRRKASLRSVLANASQTQPELDHLLCLPTASNVESKSCCIDNMGPATPLWSLGNDECVMSSVQHLILLLAEQKKKMLTNFLSADKAWGTQHCLGKAVHCRGHIDSWGREKGSRQSFSLWEWNYNCHWEIQQILSEVWTQGANSSLSRLHWALFIVWAFSLVCRMRKAPSKAGTKGPWALGTQSTSYSQEWEVCREIRGCRKIREGEGTLI